MFVPVIVLTVWCFISSFFGFLICEIIKKLCDTYLIKIQKSKINFKYLTSSDFVTLTRTFFKHPIFSECTWIEYFLALPENFTRHPNDQYVEAGSNVRLSCEINLLPELVIEWEKDDLKLPPNELKYAEITTRDVRGSILYIFNVVPADSGSYR